MLHQEYPSTFSLGSLRLIHANPIYRGFNDALQFIGSWIGKQPITQTESFQERFKTSIATRLVPKANKRLIENDCKYTAVE